jgi:succinyl-diaminopimelate desuccinylase
LRYWRGTLVAPSKECISRFVDENWSAIVADIAELVSIKSVEDSATAGTDAPWGKGPRDALDCALRMASRLGLQAHDCGGVIGFADVPGERDGQVATIAHLDVVPAGPGWSSDPFALHRREGYLVGRGVLDDKGPAVLTLWAAHFLSTYGCAAGRKTVRILLGVNEETGMDDARWYVRNYAAPDFLFTPDSEWPVVCGEKGSHNAELSWSATHRGRSSRLPEGRLGMRLPRLPGRLFV